MIRLLLSIIILALIISLIILPFARIIRRTSQKLLTKVNEQFEESENKIKIEKDDE